MWNCERLCFRASQGQGLAAKTIIQPAQLQPKRKEGKNEAKRNARGDEENRMMGIRIVHEESGSSEKRSPCLTLRSFSAVWEGGRERREGLGGRGTDMRVGPLTEEGQGDYAPRWTRICVRTE